MLTIFVKHSTLDVWQGSEYISVICYSLFGKIEDTNAIDSVANVNLLILKLFILKILIFEIYSLKQKRNYYMLRNTTYFIL